MYDVIIIGAGPAGLSAGITCASSGLHVLILDEFMYAGGRLLGQLYQEPDGTWWNGIEESKRLADKAYTLGIDIHLQTTVINLEKQNETWIVYTEKTTYQGKKLLLATGACESPIPIPGWTLPGVMSIGAAQVMTNVHRVKPGEKGIIIGINVLSLAIAMELKLAGIELYSLALPLASEISGDHAKPKPVFTNLLSFSHMAQNPLLRWGGKTLRFSWLQNLVLRMYPKKGLSVAGLPLQIKTAVTEIIGEDKVEGVKLVHLDANGGAIPGSEHEVKVDFVCIAGGLYPLVELAALVGCVFNYIDELGGYVPLHNEYMETTVEGLYVAGNITGIEGAKVAIAQGTVAGKAILHSFGLISEKEVEDAARFVHEVRKNAPIQFHPNIEMGKRRVMEEWGKVMKKKITN